MDSLATHHFPQIVHRQNQTWLYNPVLRKRFVIRPEERVRLKWVEYLLHQTEWKKNRIGFEAPVAVHSEENKLRADLILYNDQMEPQILVECKSESVTLSAAVAGQAARYNRRVKAPFLVLTNGLKDYWFKNHNGTIHPSDPPFKQIQTIQEVYKTKNYWTERGFCSSETLPELHEDINRGLSYFWSQKTSWPSRYLNFKDSFLPFPMNHYYRIAAVDDNSKMAVGFLGDKKSGSFLVGILNRKGRNAGVVTVQLERLKTRDEGSVMVFEAEKARQPNPCKILPDSFIKFDSDIIGNLPLFLMRLFD